MKKVSSQEWLKKASNFQERISKSPYAKNLSHYRNIINLIEIGNSILDVGCGEKYISEVIPDHVEYIGIDPIPRKSDVLPVSAEGLSENPIKADTVIMFAALDNTMDVKKALQGLKASAKMNIAILTGIGIPPDRYHTHQIDYSDLTDVLGTPKFKTKMSPSVYLFEWFV